VYFKRFDDAEDLYRQMDRLDLAIGLRTRLGEYASEQITLCAAVPQDATLHATA
jgi:hypothetical protein